MTQQTHCYALIQYKNRHRNEIWQSYNVGVEIPAVQGCTQLHMGAQKKYIFHTVCERVAYNMPYPLH